MARYFVGLWVMSVVGSLVLACAHRREPEPAWVQRDRECRARCGERCGPSDWEDICGMNCRKLCDRSELMTHLAIPDASSAD